MNGNVRNSLVAAALAVLLVAGLVATMVWMQPRSSTPAASAPEPGLELGGQVMLITKPGGHVEMCTVWGEPLPPSCGGTEVVGEVDWDAIDAETYSGVAWAEGVWVVGTFDEGLATFTLMRPPALDAPVGVDVPEPVEYEFPALCDDPRRGAADGSTDDEGLLHGAMMALPGYANSYVSDGRDFYNVIVNDDAEAAHEALREVWQGDLCVVERDLPTWNALQSASDAVFNDPQLRGLVVTGGAGGIDGKLHVEVLVATDDVVARILGATGPHVDEEFVVITGAYRPMG